MLIHLALASGAVLIVLRIFAETAVYIHYNHRAKTLQDTRIMEFL